MNAMMKIANGGVEMMIAPGPLNLRAMNASEIPVNTREQFSNILKSLLEAAYRAAA